MTFIDPAWFAGLALLPMLALVVMALAAVRRRRLYRLFGGEVRRQSVLRSSRSLAVVTGATTLAGLALVIVGLARPAYDPQPRKVRQSGRDVVFVLDVSRSMLASDIRPSRLARAKLALGDVLDAVEGDRVGIVAFAGAAVTRCPLTNDYAFARMVLDELSPDSIMRGGTAIGDAIRTATILLKPDDPGAPARTRDIILITDGEDHESDPLAAAREAGEAGIRIIAIGLGSESVGAPVPAPELDDPRQRSSGTDYLQYQGERVQSRLDARTMGRIAEAAAEGSVFLNVGTGNIELDRVYKQLASRAAAETGELVEAVQYTEAFQAALLAALSLLVVEPMIQLIRRR